MQDKRIRLNSTDSVNSVDRENFLDVEIKQHYNQLTAEVGKLYKHIEPEKLNSEIKELEEKLQQKEVWENQ